MRNSRSRINIRALLAVSLGCGLAVHGPALARTGTTTAPTPFTPGDTSKPAFDTTTAVYDAVPPLGKSASTVVAEVEGRAITIGDVGDAIRALPPALAQLPFETLYPSILQQLINQQALVVRAQQHGVDEDPAIRRKVRAAADRQLGEEYIRWEITKSITEAALLDRYNRDLAGRPGAEEVRIRVILTDTDKEALSLIAELRGGADFAAVARRSSKDTTAPAGGDLAFLTREGLSPEIGAVAFALVPGQLAPAPVRSGDRWFIVKLEERRTRPTPTFAAAREQLTQAMVREGIAPLIEASLRDLKVRKYNFLGQEIEPDKEPPAQ